MIEYPKKKIFSHSNLLFFLITTICIFYGLQVLTIANLTPDSFAYLDGAKNILIYGQYRYDANSQIISLFPPLYSLFISFFFKVLGVRALSVLILNTLFYILAIFLLFRIRKLFLVRLSESLIIFLIIAHTLLSTMSYVLSECLYIPLTIVWLYMIQSNKKFEFIFVLLTLLLELAIVSSRYAGILIIASWYVSDVLNNLLSGHRMKYFLKSQNLIRYSVPLITLIYFLLLRIWISADGPHHNFIPGSGKYKLSEYFSQAIGEIGGFFIGEAAAFQLSQKGWMLPISLLVIGLFFSLCKVIINRGILLFLVVCMSIHVIVLWSVWVDDGLAGRYFIWVYLTLFVSAKLEWRQNLSPKLRTIFYAFLCFVILSNDLYFLKKNNIAVRNVEYNNRIGFSDYFKTGYKYSVELKEPDFIWQKNHRYLVSPCYSWNIPNSNKSITK